MKRWVIASPDPALIEQLMRDLELPSSLAKVLVNRGFVDKLAAETYLRPQLKHLADPFELPNMKPAVERLLPAIEKRERIVIYGDYDVDGVTSSALLYRVLSVAGADVSHFLPLRNGEGYGLSDEGLARCVHEHNPQLLIAADCGTSSAREIAALCKKGIDVIVLDHHEPPETLPDCVAVVNPKIVPKGGTTIHSALASVGVAFKLAHALLKVGRERNLPWASKIDLRDHLDLVAVGTVADLVPLTRENRTFVKAGLERLTHTDNVGLQALIEVAGLRTTITPYDIGFKLGPRLNAAGRLADAKAALELLLTNDMRRARELAAQLNAQNTERQQVQEQIVTEAWEMIRNQVDLTTDLVVVLARDSWHTGVVGIVASRILQALHRPTIVIGIEDGIGKGSCRSIPGFSMVEALNACSDLLIKHGGHEMAAGLSIEAGKVEAFRKRINEYAREKLGAELLQPRLAVDAEVPLAELDFEFLRKLQGFEPCGIENPVACFMVRQVTVHGQPRVVGGKHLRFDVTDGNATASAIWWNRNEPQLPTAPFDVAFTLTLNEYQGIASLQLTVRDVRPAE